MTRASLGHTGRPLTAGRGTAAIYILVTLAAVLRVLTPFAGGSYVILLSLAAAAWSGAFGLFVLLYAPVLMLPRLSARAPEARRFELQAASAAPCVRRIGWASCP